VMISIKLIYYSLHSLIFDLELNNVK